MTSIATTDVSSGVTKGFPSRLYRFLEDAEVYNLSHVASWQPNGRCFRIHDPKAFVTASTRWFSYSKYESFQRQLNIYGFTRIKRGTDKSCYYHKNFIRGQYLLASGIDRVPVKKLPQPSINQASNPDLHSTAMLPESTTPSPIATNTNEQIPIARANDHSVAPDRAEMYDEQVTAAWRLITQPYTLRDTASLSSRNQSIDVNRIINQYISNALINNVFTSHTSANALPISSFLLQNSTLSTNQRNRFDIDTSTRSVLQKTERADTCIQSVTDPSMLPCLPTDSLALTSQQQLQSHGPTVLALLEQQQNEALMNYRRLTSPTETDPSTLLLILAAQNQLRLSQLVSASSRSHLQQQQQHPYPFAEGSISQQPAASHNISTFIRNAMSQPNPTNRRVPDEQTIRDAILALRQQQFSTSTDNEDRLT